MKGLEEFITPTTNPPILTIKYGSVHFSIVPYNFQWLQWQTKYIVATTGAVAVVAAVAAVPVVSGEGAAAVAALASADVKSSPFVDAFKRRTAW